jgi:Fe-S-cluster containining protein
MPTEREIELAAPARRSGIAGAVDGVYGWIDSQISQNPAQCDACGKCCDFENYDHRLFVTSPELTYFALKLDPDKIKPMPAGRCPYNIDGKCIVYPFRFAGCRIFSCKRDKEIQNRLSEQAVVKFKAICEKFRLPYRYTDLPTALNKATI